MSSYVFELTDVSIANGSDTLQINNSDSVFGAIPGSMLWIDSYRPRFVQSVDNTARTVTLTANWDGADVVNKPATIAPTPTISEQQTAVDAVNNVTASAQSLLTRFLGLEATYQDYLNARFSELSTLVNGALPFDTLANLVSFGNPATNNYDSNQLSRVWNDPIVANNGIYGWTGAAWSKSPYTPPELTQDIETASPIDTPSALAIRKYLGVDLVVPAGANLLDVDNATDGYFMDPDGNFEASAAYRVSDYIAVTPGASYSLYAYTTDTDKTPTAINFRKTCFFDSVGNVVAGGSDTDVHTFTVPLGAVYLRGSVYNSRINRQQTLVNDAEYPNAITEPYAPLWSPGVTPVSAKSLFNARLIQESSEPDAAVSRQTLLDIAATKATVETLSNNLADPGAFASEKYIGAQGQIINLTGYTVTGFIPVSAGQTYYFLATEPEKVGRNYAFYDSSKSMLIVTDNPTYQQTITAPANADWLRFTFRSEATYAGVGVINNPTAYAPGVIDESGQRIAVNRLIDAIIESESDSPAAAISRRTAEQLISEGVGGKISAYQISDINLLAPGTETEGGYIQADGNFISSASYSYSAPIAVTPGQTYTGNYNGSTTDVFRKTCFYDANNAVVSGGIDSYHSQFTVPLNAAFVVVSVQSPTNGRLYSLHCLREGTSTAFVAYDDRIVVRMTAGNQFDNPADVVAKRNLDAALNASPAALLESGRLSEVNLLAPGTETEGAFINPDGAISSLSSYSYSEQIPVVAGQTYTGNYNGSTTDVFRKSCFYSASGSVVPGGTDGWHNSFTVPVGAAFVVVSVQSPVNGRTYSLHCLREGTSTVFEAYTTAQFLRVKSGIEKSSDNARDMMSRADVIALLDALNIDTGNLTPPTPLELVQARFTEALQSANRYTYVVAGDSTRDAPNGRAMPYYIEQCAKINFDVVDNATSGQTLSDWLNNVDDTTLQQAIDATPGTGATTIMELSLGINDYTDGGITNATNIETMLGNAISQYLAAKPDALILLVSPVRTWRGDFFEPIYQAVASSFSLPLVSGYAAMGETYPDTTWYADTTHPNWYGSMRLVNFIFNSVLPASAKLSMWITDNQALGLDLPALTISNGYWDTSTGAWSATTTWRSTQKIPVDPSSVLTITHNGNRMDCLMYDADGNFIKNTQKMADIYLTPRTHFVAFNISSDGSTWDGLSETPVVVYSPNFTIYPYLRQRKINEGNSISLPYRSQLFVDKSGVVGQSGQSAVSDGAGDFSWSD